MRSNRAGAKTGEFSLSQTRIGQMIVQKMEEQALSMRDVAKRLDVTYEHVRRIVRGEAVPSKLMLRLICQELNLDVSKAERLATADSIRRKYGKLPLELAGKKPSLEPLERVWDQLSQNQQRDLIAMAEIWLLRNQQRESE